MTPRKAQAVEEAAPAPTRRRFTRQTPANEAPAETTAAAEVDAEALTPKKKAKRGTRKPRGEAKAVRRPTTVAALLKEADKLTAAAGRAREKAKAAKAKDEVREAVQAQREAESYVAALTKELEKATAAAAKAEERTAKVETKYSA